MTTWLILLTKGVHAIMDYYLLLLLLLLMIQFMACSLIKTKEFNVKGKTIPSKRKRQRQRQSERKTERQRGREKERQGQ